MGCEAPRSEKSFQHTHTNDSTLKATPIAKGYTPNTNLGIVDFLRPPSAFHGTNE